MSELEQKMLKMFSEVIVKCMLGESAVSSFLAEKRVDELKWLRGQCDFSIREQGPSPTHKPGTINPEFLRLARECIQKELEKRGAG